MFTVKESNDAMHNWFISDGQANYMHRDGEIVHDAVEYWPTEERAQAVLDKFQPEHVWEHGDVYDAGHSIGMYIESALYGKIVVNLEYPDRGGSAAVQLAGSKFLYNIKDKLKGFNG